MSTRQRSARGHDWPKGGFEAWRYTDEAKEAAGLLDPDQPTETAHIAWQAEQEGNR